MGQFQRTREADARLEEIWLYSARMWGTDQADLYQDKLEAAFQRIADGRAATHSCARFFAAAPEEIRYSHVEQHYVIYCPSEDQTDSIDVLSIIHESSNKQLVRFLEDQME